jgi:hypothetical protein
MKKSDSKATLSPQSTTAGSKKNKSSFVPDATIGNEYYVLIPPSKGGLRGDDINKSTIQKNFIKFIR